MTSIDFSAPITGLDDLPVVEDDKPVTLGKVAVNALIASLTDARGQPEQLTGEAKVHHAVLAETIFKAFEPVDLKAEDIALLKDRIGRAYTPLAVMRAWHLLDPPAQA